MHVGIDQGGGLEPNRRQAANGGQTLWCLHAGWPLHIARITTWQLLPFHSIDVIMSTMASSITGVSIVYSTVCSGAGKRKDQSSASLACVRGIHRWPLNSPHKVPVTRKMIPFDGIMCNMHLHGLVQDCSNSSVLAMELLQCCAKPSLPPPSIWCLRLNTVQFSGTLMPH